jgi:Siphovirus Gp157
MDSLSLYTIEDGLAQLLDAREALNQELIDHDAMSAGNAALLARDVNEIQAELTVVEETLATYEKNEPAKVDAYHHFLTAAAYSIKAMEREEIVLRERRKRLEQAAAYVKQRALFVMQSFGKKRLDGTNGRYLSRQPNGGMVPLDIDNWHNDVGNWIDPTRKTTLPESYQNVHVVMPADVYAWILREFDNDDEVSLDDVKVVASGPCGARIREALARPCKECEGGRIIDGLAKTVIQCQACSGTGHYTVPGAFLGDRGEHLRVR